MRRNQKNYKRRSTKLVQRPLIYTGDLPSNLLPASSNLIPYSFFPPTLFLIPSSLQPPTFFLLPSSLQPSSFFLTSVTSVTSVTESVAELPASCFFQLIAGNTFGSGGQLHCTGDSNGNSFVKNRWYNVLFVNLRRAD